MSPHTKSPSQAIRQLRDGLDQLLSHYEPLCKDLMSHADEAFGHVASALFGEKSRKKSSPD